MSEPDSGPERRLLRAGGSYPSNGNYPPALRDLDGTAGMLTLRRVLEVLRRNRLLVLAATLIMGGVGVYLARLEQPRYMAFGLLRVANTERGLFTTGIAFDQGVGSAELQARILVLQGPDVGRRAVRLDPLLRIRTPTGEVPLPIFADLVIAPDVEFELLRLEFSPTAYSVQTSRGEASAAYGERVDVAGVSFQVDAMPSVARIEYHVLPVNDAAAWILNGLRAQVHSPAVDVVNVSFTSTIPVYSQRVVNAILDGFLAYDLDRSRRASIQRREFIGEQLYSTDSLLIRAQEALSAFRTREQVLSLRTRFGAQQSGVMSLEVDRETYQSDRMMYAALLSSLERDSGTTPGNEIRTLVSSPGIAANPVVSQLYGQLVGYESERDQLTAGTGGRSETHEDVQRLNSLISAAEVRLLDAVRSHIVAIDARIAALDGLKERTAAQIEELPGLEAEEVRLTQQVDAIHSMGNELRMEQMRAQMAVAVETGQAEVVRRAILPVSPTGSRKPQKVFLGLMLGVLLGTGAAFARESTNTSIRRKDEVESFLGVPSLAVIPQIASSTNGRSLASSAVKRLPGMSRIGNGSPGTDAGNLDLVTVSDFRSSGAEAYRSLRTNLIFSQALRSLKTIVVTSAVPGEGKTTTVSNLAVAFAQQGMRVLLVDCDVRKARLHHVFSVPREPGFTEYLLGWKKPMDIVHRTSVDGLFFIPAGKMPAGPAELFGSPRMKDVLRALTDRFDLVLLDTAPLLAAVDAAVLGADADGVILVVRAGMTDQDLARHAVQQLERVGANVLGAVLNDPDSEVPVDGGYYYYHYYGEQPA